VHGIVTDLGGAIDVTTKPGEGTRFEVWLPVAGEAAKPTVVADRELPRGSHQRVMIVDDEPALVELCEEILADVGYEPVGFSSSTQALQRFRADPARFDVVLTDEAMPDLTGAELAREIRETAVMPDTVQPHILVVDDDPQIRELLEGYLAENQLRVSVAATSAQMSQILADQAIDLVVLDLRLAGEDGMMIARTLRTE